MIVSYYSVKDKKANMYQPAFPSQTAGTAERSFSEAVNNPDTMIGKYPDDFALYRLFELNDESGALHFFTDDLGEIILPVPILIVEGSTLVKSA